MKIVSHSSAYLTEGYKHPYGEKTPTLLGAVKRVLSRSATYLYGMSVISAQGAYLHTKEAIGSSGKFRIRKLATCSKELLHLSNAIEIISITLLFAGVVTPIAKTLFISSIAVQILIPLGKALYYFHLAEKNPKITRFHDSGVKELKKELPQVILISGLMLYFKSFDAILKPLAVIKTVVRAAEFVQYSTGYKNVK